MESEVIRTWSRVSVACLLVVAVILPHSGCALEGASGGVTAAWWPETFTQPVEPARTAATATNTASAGPMDIEPVSTTPTVPQTAQPTWVRPFSPPVHLAAERSASSHAPILLPSSGVAGAQVATPPVPANRPVKRAVLHVDASTFDQQVLRSDVPVLVDFYASWCGPCQALAPTLDELAAESPLARIVKVNVDESPTLSARYGVQSIPSLMVFSNGQVVARQTGVASKTRLAAMLDLNQGQATR